MSLEQVLLERLNTDSDITNIVGDRIIRGGTAQDTALPFLAYQISAAESVQALDGGTSLTNYTVEIAVASQTYSEARNILDAVRARIDNSTWDGVQGSFFQSEEISRDDDTQFFVCGQTYLLVFDDEQSFPGTTGPDYLILNKSVRLCDGASLEDCDGVPIGANAITEETFTSGTGYVFATEPGVEFRETIPHTDVTGLGTLATQSGTFSGTSSGTNTGDQTITLTGDVTGSGTGSFSTTLATVPISKGGTGATSLTAGYCKSTGSALTTVSSIPASDVTGLSGGTVTQVRMTGDGVVFDTVVPGDPISTSGTFAPVLSSTTQNYVLAGPASGGNGQWVSRALVSADLPTVPVSKGGTGATDAATARTNLGAGTVTSVSVTTANGVSGSVATATSTPAITLTLGDITPNSINVATSPIQTPAAFAIGGTASHGTLGTNALAIGLNATAVGNSSSTIGVNATNTTGTSCVTIGNLSTTGANNAVAVGASSSAGGASATAVGPSASASGSGGVAIGSGATCTGTNGVSLGISAANTASTQAVVIGSSASADTNSCIAIGPNAVATGSSVSGSIAIGVNTTTSGAAGAAIALGGSASVTGQRGIAIGTSSISAGGIALGYAVPSTADGVFQVKPRTSSAGNSGCVFRTAGYISDGSVVSVGDITTSWISGTAGSNNSRATISTYYTTTAQEGLRIDSASDQARLGLGGSVVSGQRCTVYAGVSTDVALVAKAASSQSADIFQVQNSTGTVLANIDANGYFCPHSYVWGLKGSGAVQTGTNMALLHIVERACKITKAFAVAKVAPTGSAIIFDIRKSSNNGVSFTSLWATNTGNRLSIADGSLAGTQTSFDTTTLAEGDVLAFDVAQVGSTVAGQDVTVKLLVQQKNQ